MFGRLILWEFLEVNINYLKCLFNRFKWLFGVSKKPQIDNKMSHNKLIFTGSLIAGKFELLC
jgi:hypothetical protein